MRWGADQEQAWSRVLRACSTAAASVRGARCVLRSILSLHLRVPSREPYDDLRKHVQPLADATDVATLDGFEGFWDGAHRGLLQHHDSTRIHFSDLGRWRRGPIRVACCDDVAWHR